jgi:hypothetical protein
MAKKKPAQRTTVNSVANALDTHEQVCQQRWQENYRRLDSIESMILTNNQRLWWFAGIILTLLMSLVIKSFV